MCHGDDSRPPLPPILSIGGAAADQGDFVLTSSDRTKLGAYFARAARPSGAGMVVMPDVRGLHQFYKELAQRFAEAGIDAVAIDYFGRTAGIGDRSEGFEYMPHVEKTTQENIAVDVARELGRRLSTEGVPHEMHVYEGAPHSFFDRAFAQWKDACDDAWRRMLDFVKKHS